MPVEEVDGGDVLVVGAVAVQEGFGVFVEPGGDVIKLFFFVTGPQGQRARLSLPGRLFKPVRGVRYLTGENLEVVWAEFSTLS